MTELHASVKCTELDRPRQDVCQREEQQGGLLFVEHVLLDPLGTEDVVHEGEQVAVGQYATLGLASRSRGVDDSCGGLRTHGVPAFCHRGGPDAEPRLHQLEAIDFQLPDVAQARQLGAKP